ncbi:MAG TPA: hypothetical protein VM073_03110 [Usitatibacter sp.]|nr:hypothetical protein [Usitatibacter sp.]
MKRALLLLAFWVAAATALAQPAEPRSLRILFVGNSITTGGDIPERVAKLAAAMGRTAKVETVASDDFSLEDHWRDGRALAAIQKGWDVVVLQGGGPARGETREKLVESSRQFAQAVRAAKAKPAQFMAWPAADRVRDFPVVIASHRLAAAAADSMLLPVGEAWLRALSADKRLRLYSGATNSAALGSDLAVLTIYLSLFPAGHQEFDDAFVARAAKALGVPDDRRDLLFDAATRAIDEPMALE